MAAHPLKVLVRRSPAADLASLRQVVEDREVDRIVLGLPLEMSGREGSMAIEVRRFGAKLEQELGLPVLYEDERLTTDAAEALLQERGLRPPERRKLRDSLAAALVLEAYLEHQRRQET